jgi:hypothetical protein
MVVAGRESGELLGAGDVLLPRGVDQVTFVPRPVSLARARSPAPVDSNPASCWHAHPHTAPTRTCLAREASTNSHRD